MKLRWKSWVWNGIDTSQTEITLKEKITDGEKEKPIPYASIGIPSKYTGSVSGPEGDFVLTLSPEHLTDTLQFTAIGYHTKKYQLHPLLIQHLSK